MRTWKWPNATHLSISFFAVLLVFLTPAAGFGQSASTSPISIAIIFDQSASTASPSSASAIKPKEFIKALAPLFQLPGQNQYFVISVASTPTVVLDGSRDGEAAFKTLSKLASARRAGATALYDACYLGIEKVTQGAYPKRVLLVVSDGVDTLSEKKLGDVKGALSGKGITLYAINSGNPKDKFNAEGAKHMEEMASASGGALYRPEQAEELNKIVASIVASLQK